MSQSRTADPTPRQANSGKGWKARLRPVLMLLGTAFVAALAVKSWPEVQRLVAGTHWGLVLLSIVVAHCGNLVTIRLLGVSFRKYAIELDATGMLKLYFFGQIAKYVPGKIWALVYQRSMLAESGNTVTLVLSNVELMAACSAIVAGMGLGLVGFALGLPHALAFIALGCLAAVITVGLPIIPRLLHRLPDRFKPGMPGPAPTAWTPLCLLIAAWAMAYLLGHWFFMSSLQALHGEDLVLLIGMLGLSWLAGFLSIVAPGGIGVRELAFLALGHYADTGLSLEMLAALAVATRIWIIVQEMVGVSYATAVAALQRRRGART